MSQKILILTGNIAGGKSTIAEILKSFGYPVLDADTIAKEILYGRELAKTKKILGDDIVEKDGVTIKKDLIRNRLFENPAVQLNLNVFTASIVAPEIMKRVAKINSEPCFVEMALLYEFYEKNAWREYFSGVIAICCERETAITRMKLRNPNIPEDVARKILDVQIPFEKKLELADVSLDTTHMKKEEYEPWVKKIWPNRNCSSSATM